MQRLPDLSAIAARLARAPAPFVSLSLLAIVAPLLAVFSFSSLPGAVILAALFWMRPSAISQSFRAWLRAPVLLALFALAGWAAITLAWTPDVFDAGQTFVRAIILIGAGLVMTTTLGRVPEKCARFSDQNTRKNKDLEHVPDSDNREHALGSASWNMQQIEGPLLMALAALLALMAVEAATAGELYRIVAGYAPGAAPGFVVTPAGEAAPKETLMVEIATATVFLATLVWPASLLVAARWRTPLLGALVIVAVGAVILMHVLSAAKLAFLLGGAVFALVWAGGRRAGLVVMAIVMAGVAAAPWAAIRTMNAVEASRVYAALDPASQQRVHIYRYAGERALEQPLFGHGFNASRILSRDAPRINLGEGLESMSVLPLHPHDAPLQIWLELGAVGAGISLVFLWFLGAAMLRASGDGAKRIIAARFAVFIALATFASVSFGAWRYGWLSAIMLVVIANALLEKALRARGPNMPAP